MTFFSFDNCYQLSFLQDCHSGRPWRQPGHPGGNHPDGERRNDKSHFSHFQMTERPFKNDLNCSCWRTCVCVLCMRRCWTVRQSPLRTTRLWRSLSNSHCWTTWSSRSSRMSKCPCTCTDTHTATCDWTDSWKEIVFHCAGSSSVKAGWKPARTREPRTSWEQPSILMMYVKTDRRGTLINLWIDYIMVFFRSATGLQQRSCSGTISTCVWLW